MSAMDSPHGRAAYQTVGRMVCDTLHIGDEDALEGLRAILRIRLTRGERQALLWAVLRACDTEDAMAVIEGVIPPESRAGWPVVPLEDVVSEAAFWADMASPIELRVYAGVCLARLPKNSRRAV